MFSVKCARKPLWSVPFSAAFKFMKLTKCVNDFFKRAQLVLVKTISLITTQFHRETPPLQIQFLGTMLIWAHNILMI